MRPTKSTALWGMLALAAALPVAGMSGFVGSAQAASSSRHMNISCYNSAGLCTEVGNSEEVFGEDHYVGHDEPGVHFFSDQPGAGKRVPVATEASGEPAGLTSKRARQVLHVRAEQRVVVRHDAVRHHVVSRAGVHVQAGQR